MFFFAMLKGVANTIKIIFGNYKKQFDLIFLMFPIMDFTTFCN